MCGRAGGGRVVWSVPYRVIWERLTADWEVIIPEAVARRNTPAVVAKLLSCPGCGLEYFDPARSGDAEYYLALAASPRYYNAWKWEFGWVAERLLPGSSVLDVGCGRGDFLAHAGPRVGRAVGLEPDPVTAAVAAARGLAVVSGDLASFARANEGAFDAACLFHVVEHLPEIRPFLRHLLSCLKPGGSMYLSVPNRNRYLKGVIEPLDCPPHHVSRWAPAQMVRLASLAGVTLSEFALEPVDVSLLREEMPVRFRRRLEEIPAVGAFLGRWSTRILWRTLFRKSLCPIYAQTRLFDRFGCHGLSMVGRYVSRFTERGGG
ncbi:MAG: Methyltransferase type 12 [Deltaproteobacteria bacterium]|nr:Methyltransferase type 12 [Deltaproteobacteria bacterium]